MKNLFKNLMLVAVAAMAFTACSQDVNEVNNVERTVRYEFTANFADDTRSGFAEETSTNDIGKTVYHSEWFGNETLFLVPNVGESTTAPISAEGKFSVDLSSNATQINIYSPASSWSDYGSYCLANVPAEQTSGVNSVDPKAHIVSGYAMVDANGNQIIPVTLSHAVAYGKMTVNGVDFDIDHVVVDLKGSFSGYARELSYTINAANVENNTFWFATEPIDVAEFTVTAYDEDNAVTKTIDVAALENKTLSFNCGRVSTFSVSGLEVVEPEVPGGGEDYDDTGIPAYHTSDCSSAQGQDRYVWFYTNDDSLAPLRINFWNVFDESTNVIRPGTYTEGGNGLYTGYSTYGGKALKNLTVTVSYVVEGYRVVFENLVDKSTGELLFEKVVFVGHIEGLGDVSTTPKMIISDSELKFASEASSKSVVVTLKNYEAEVFASSSNDHFTTSVNGNEVIITAKENETSDSIFGVITITAGDKTAEVNVEQVGAGQNADLFKSVSYAGGDMSWAYIALNFEDASGVTLYCEFNLLSTTTMAGSYTGKGNGSGKFYSVYYKNDSSKGDFKYDESTLQVVEDGDNYVFTFDFKFTNYSFTGTQIVSKSIV